MLHLITTHNLNKTDFYITFWKRHFYQNTCYSYVKDHAINYVDHPTKHRININYKITQYKISNYSRIFLHNRIKFIYVAGMLSMDVL